MTTAAPWILAGLQVEIARVLLDPICGFVVPELAAALSAVLPAAEGEIDLPACLVALGFARSTALFVGEGNPVRVAVETHLDALDALAASAAAERTMRPATRRDLDESSARTSATGDFLVDVATREPCVGALLAARATQRHVVAMLRAVA
jgi:hypothetical protein